ncbi:hypothetical protein D1007_51342 [Hordeum vulgare]|nr:hypothetical protein D1007_51342 [Hordeum vulgare]
MGNIIWNTYYYERVPQGTEPCGSYWWRNILKLLDNFREFTWVQVNQGDTVLFWQDKWNIGNSVIPLKERLSRLFSYVKDPWTMVKEGLNTNDMSTWFNLPLLEQTYMELSTVHVLIGEFELSPNQNDVWYCPSTNKFYTPKSFYSYAHREQTLNPLLNSIWASCYTLNIKVFSWMLIMDRLNTKDMVEWRN